MTDQADEALELAAAIAPMLRGRGELVQAAALADLVARWLAGHFAETPAETAAVRRKLLAEHVAIVDRLVAPNEAAILERIRRGAS